MENDSGMASGASATKSAKPSGTSAKKKSRKTAGKPTSPETLLRILTQAARDIADSQECQERGITVAFYNLYDDVFVRVVGGRLDHNDVIVPRTQEDSAKNEHNAEAQP